MALSVTYPPGGPIVMGPGYLDLMANMQGINQLNRGFGAGLSALLDAKRYHADQLAQQGLATVLRDPDLSPDQQQQQSFSAMLTPNPPATTLSEMLDPGRPLSGISPFGRQVLPMLLHHQVNDRFQFQGFSPSERQKARRIKAGLEPRASQPSLAAEQWALLSPEEQAQAARATFAGKDERQIDSFMERVWDRLSDDQKTQYALRNFGVGPGAEPSLSNQQWNLLSDAEKRDASLYKYGLRARPGSDGGSVDASSDRDPFLQALGGSAQGQGTLSRVRLHNPVLGGERIEINRQGKWVKANPSDISMILRSVLSDLPPVEQQEIQQLLRENNPNKLMAAMKILLNDGR